MERIDARAVLTAANSDWTNMNFDALEVMSRHFVNIKDALHQTLEDNARLERLYHDLLFAVRNKHEGEERHETARRYIIEAEANASGPFVNVGGPDA